jgi:hypothetical protein
VGLESLEDHEVVAAYEEDTHDTVVEADCDDSALVRVRVAHDVGARTCADKLPSVELPVLDEVPHHYLAILADSD